MPTASSYARRFTTLVAVLALLAACGDGADEDGAAVAPPETTGTDAADTDEPSEVVEGLLDDLGTVDEPAEEPFDPDAGIRPADIEVSPMGSSELERPWEILVLPDDFVLPASARQVTWAPPEEPFAGAGSRHGGSGAFQLYRADTEAVAAFFTDRLPAQGWELEDEERDGDTWQQTWSTVVLWDGWEEDWQAEEFGVSVEVRFVHLPSDADPDRSTLQFYYGAEWVRL